MTYVGGGFFLDYQDCDTCGDSRISRARPTPRTTPAGPRAIGRLPVEHPGAATTARPASRADRCSARIRPTRPTWDAKTDGTYFLTHMLGGDHSLKFGLGYRKAPIVSFSHYSGGAQARVQCVGNTLGGCGDGNCAAAGSAAGIVPFSAVALSRPAGNNDWWSYNGYIQDSYSRGRIAPERRPPLRLAAVQVPRRLRAGQRRRARTCCRRSAKRRRRPTPSNGKKIQAFGNWSPRLSATYDLFGNGKTQVHASGSYYYDTEDHAGQRADRASSRTTTLTWGTNQSNGLCSTTAGASCWNDANRDGVVQANELIGTPTASSARFNLNTGVLDAGRQHRRSERQDRPHARGDRRHAARADSEPGGRRGLHLPQVRSRHDDLHDRLPAGRAGYPAVADLRAAAGGYTDPVTGLNAPYYVICHGCSRPSGLGSITMTNPDYQIYQGVDITATKRYSNKWQMQTALTHPDQPELLPGRVGDLHQPDRTWSSGTAPARFRAGT